MLIGTLAFGSKGVRKLAASGTDKWEMKTMEYGKRLPSKPVMLSIVARKLKRSREYQRFTSSFDEDDFSVLSSECEIVENTPAYFDDLDALAVKKMTEVFKSNSSGEDPKQKQANSQQETANRPRRYAICEETERRIYNDGGMSLRKFRKFLVTHYVLSEMHLL